MVQRAQTGLVAVKPALPPGSGINNAPPQPLDHGLWLPAVTPGSRDLVVFPGVYPFLSWHRFGSPVNGHIPVVWLGIGPVQELILPLNGQSPQAPMCRPPQVSV